MVPCSQKLSPKTQWQIGCSWSLLFLPPWVPARSKGQVWSLSPQSTPGDSSSHTPWLQAEVSGPCHPKQGSHLHFRWTPTCQPNNTTIREAFTQVTLIKTQMQTQASHATIISNIIRMIGSASPLTAKQHLFKD